MPTIRQVIIIGKICSGFAGNENAKKKAFGSGVIDKKLPILIFTVTKVIERIYNQNVGFVNLLQATIYLYFLCQKYVMQSDVRAAVTNTILTESGIDILTDNGPILTQ